MIEGMTLCLILLTGVDGLRRRLLHRFLSLSSLVEHYVGYPLGDALLLRPLFSLDCV